jgi:hypothetical protein
MGAISRLSTAVRVALAAGALALALACGGLALAGRRASAALDAGLRERFPDPQRASFSRAGVSFLRGLVFVDGVRLSQTIGGAAVRGEVERASWSVPVRALALGHAAPAWVTLSAPKFSIRPSSAPAEGEEPVESPAGRPRAATVLDYLPAQGLSAEGGQLTLESPWGGAPLAWEKVQLRVERREPGGYDVRLQGRLAGTPGGASFQARFDDLASPCESEGQLKIDPVPVAKLAGYFPASPDVRFKDGTVSLTSTFTCRKGWLTASHLVEVHGFDAEVSSGTKELFGVSVKYLQDLFKVEQLSFVVPMTGELSDPHIGVGSSIQQILLKILEGKFDDKEDAEKLARKGGDYFGKKLDKAIKAWMKSRRK